VICRDSLKEDFRYHIKQKGALLAKGRLIGIQFLELFRDNLFFDLAIHANKLAGRIRDELVNANVKFLTHSPSNQIFPILTNAVIKELQTKYAFHIWVKVDSDSSAIRLVTSWATKEGEVNSLIEDLKKLL
jgi:threonine aldolase